MRKQHLLPHHLLLLLLVLLVISQCCEGKVNYLDKFQHLCTVVQDENTVFELSSVRILSYRYKSIVSLMASRGAFMNGSNVETGYYALAVHAGDKYRVYVRAFGVDDSLLPVYFVNELDAYSDMQINGTSSSKEVEQGYRAPDNKLAYFGLTMHKYGGSLHLFGSYTSQFNESDGVLPSPDFFIPFNVTLRSTGTDECLHRGIYSRYRYFGDQFSYICLYISLALDLIVLISTMIVVILLRKRRLVKTRMLAPYISFITLTLFKLCSAHDFPMNPRGGYVYFSFGTISVGFIVAGLLFYSLVTIRYFYIRSLYMVILKRQDSDNSNLSIHSRLTSTTAIIIALVVVLIITLMPIILSYTLFWVDFSVTLSKSFSAIFTIIIFAFLCLLPVISSVVGSGAFIVEFIAKFKKIRQKGISWYFIFDDPLLIRIEVFLYTFITVPFILAFASIAFYLLIVVDDVGSFCTPKSCATLGRIIRWLIKGFISSPCIWALTFTYGGGFVCMVEVLRSVTGTKQAERTDANKEANDEFSELTSVLEDTEMCVFFEKYAASEWSIENYRLAKRLMQFKKMDTDVPYDEFKKLFDQFIAQLSPMQVNLPSETVKEMQALLDRTQQPVTLAELKNLDLNTMHNLNDTFRRFSNTTVFANVQKRKNMELELMKKTYKE